MRPYLLIGPSGWRDINLDKDSIWEMFSLDFQADCTLLEFLLHSPLDSTMKLDRSA